MDSDKDYRYALNQSIQETNQTYCGTYCRNIGPEDQRKIILECLRIEINNKESGKVRLTKQTGDMETLAP